MPDQLKQLEKVAKALSDRNRLQILQTVASKNEISCMELMETVKLAQPTISHHIKTLTEAGLLTTEKDGRFVKLSVNPEKLEEMRNFIQLLQQTK